MQGCLYIKKNDIAIRPVRVHMHLLCAKKKQKQIFAYFLGWLNVFHWFQIENTTFGH